jgi:hypothetical protein
MTHADSYHRKLDAAYREALARDRADAAQDRDRAARDREADTSYRIALAKSDARFEDVAPAERRTGDGMALRGVNPDYSSGGNSQGRNASRSRS